MTADAPDPVDRLLAERECERLITEFVRRLDLGEPGSVADLFTPGGIWEWPDGDRRVEGRDALRLYFGSRPADRLSRRLMTNILVTLTSATTASATSYLVTYRVDGYTGGMLPPPLPVNIGHYEDTFSKTGGKWLLARRVTVLPFGRETERLLPAPAIIRTRPLPAAGYARVRDRSPAWRTQDRSHSEVLAEFGEPSMLIGGSNPRCPKTLGYAATRSDSPFIFFRLWNGKQPGAGTNGPQAIQSQYRSRPVMAARFIDGFIFTPTGAIRRCPEPGFRAVRKQGVHDPGS